ncbi:hypothetical protein [Kineococcus sp. SYSU DK004]|uniref:hypothetical protein n=1 Tax=Kineococcus sp. SYSU DK004 TaxID=3383125 RepID=UPI003D7C9930
MAYNSAEVMMVPGVDFGDVVGVVAMDRGVQHELVDEVRVLVDASADTYDARRRETCVVRVHPHRR